MDFLHVLLLLYAFSAADLCLSLFQERWHGMRLLLLAPLPAALVVGVFTLTYVVMISVDRLAWIVMTAPFVIGIWAAGFAYCAAVIAFRRVVRPRWRASSPGAQERFS